MSPLGKAKSRGPDIALILGTHHGAPDEEDDKGDDEEEGGHKGALLDAVEAFFKAGKSGDYAAASEAYETMHDLCAAKQDEDEEGDDEEGEDEE